MNFVIENQLCVCHQNGAETFCPCEWPVTLLCSPCINSHNIKNPRLAHTSMPLDKLHYFDSAEAIETFRSRSLGLTQVRGRVKTNLEELNQAINRVTEQAEHVIEEYTKKIDTEINEIILNAKNKSRLFNEKFQTQLAALRQMKEELERDTEQALNEVEATLLVELPQFTTKYALSFRVLLENNSPFRLFSVDIQTSDEPSITVNAQNLLLDGLAEQTTAPADSQIGTFAAVQGKRVELYNVQSGEAVTYTLSVNFGIGCSYVQLDNSTLLCIGAKPTDKEVYKLDLRSRTLAPQPSLRLSRQGAGVAKAASFVYAFGGSDGSKARSSCEKYGIQSRLWQGLRDMLYPRSYFTPCQFRAFIYLASGSVNAIETFNPETEVFTELPVALPIQFVRDSYSVAFIANGELCLLTTKQQAHWRMESASSISLSGINKTLWSTQPPLIVGSIVLIASSGKVEKFNLETNSFN